MKEPRRSTFQVRLHSEQIEAFNFLKNVCAYNVSEVVRQFLMKLYSEERTKRQTA